MKGIHKPFNQLDYMRFDGPGKEAAASHLRAQGYVVTVPPEDYGADLYAELGPVKIFHEIEVFTAWKSGVFPFDTGSIPERKIRLARIHINDPLFFWRLRADLLRALVFSAFMLNDKYLEMVDNRKVSTGEYFYRPPVKLGKEFDLLKL